MTLTSESSGMAPAWTSPHPLRAPSCPTPLPKPLPPWPALRSLWFSTSTASASRKSSLLLNSMSPPMLVPSETP